MTDEPTDHDEPPASRRWVPLDKTDAEHAYEQLMAAIQEEMERDDD